MGGAMGKLAGLSNKKMKNMFEKYDADKSGTVSFEELLVMLEEEKLGHENPKDNVQFLTDYLIESMADEDGDGQLDFKEFTTFCKAAKKEKKEEHKKLQGMTEPQMLDCFFKHDSDKSGTICKEELEAMMVELGIGMDDPSENAAYLDRYLHQSGADANGNGRLDFNEFKLFCQHAKVDSADRAVAKKKGGRKSSQVGQVAPSDTGSRAAKRTAGVGQTGGYSDEAKEFLRKKKEAKAKEMADIAERNRLAAKENKKRIKDKEKAASQRASAIMDNSAHAKAKAGMDKQREADAKMHRKSSQAHSREVQDKAEALNASRDAVKKQGTIDQSKMNNEYADQKAKADAQREQDEARSAKDARAHEREVQGRADELNASRDAVKKQGTIDQSKMNNEYADQKEKMDAQRVLDEAKSSISQREHEREVKGRTAELAEERAERKA